MFNVLDKTWALREYALAHHFGHIPVNNGYSNEMIKAEGGQNKRSNPVVGLENRGHKGSYFFNSKGVFMRDAQLQL